MSSPSAVSLYDARPFFEKALQHGIQHGVIGPEKIEAMRVEGPKGMVQIARYFGNEFLRPELEKARDRMVNPVSLYLESSCGGDVQRAAESLRDFSLLSRSKGGSDMLKALIAMPKNSHFGMNERGGFRDEHIPLLAKWSLRSLADYQAELARRSQVAAVVDAALWLADELGMDADELEEAGKDAEAVIRSALLVLAAGRTEMPDWPAFEKVIAALRKKHGAAPAALPVALPKKLPAHVHPAVEAVRQSVLADAPKILDAALPARALFDRSPTFMGRYFWIEDALVEVDHHARSASVAWHKLTGGNSDDGSLLTLFLCLAAGTAPKTMLSEKSATALLRKIRKSGFHPALARQHIADNAPGQHQDAYLSLWEAFVDEAQATLESDAVHSLGDALALLRRECHVRQV
ncbi:MAG: hypothetical protein H0W47_07815 [Polaromonas sp.]|uniref:hypothetical protein n=1 Tax=Polaromonas sp. TaxID=1869339 RepID=UPI0018050C05|nr:hypothetical protein [Polaromonas sp.]MBA3593695.1 hypothetical protein [Polaromonas sp.]